MSLQRIKYKILVVVIALISCILNYIFFNAYYFNLCSSDVVCIVGDWYRVRESIFEPVFIMSLSILFTSLFTFFISTKTFKRWIIFSTIWMILAALWISQASVRSTGFPSVIPTSKEEVSTWMGSLFVIISLGMFVVMTLREKCAKKTR